MDGKLLIIEDDRDTLQAMVIRLRTLGLEILSASDGISAVSTAQKQQPDLVLLDIGLPGGDGMWVLERFQSMNKINDIPIIVFSARDARVWKEKVMKAGAVDYLEKPVDTEKLFNAVRKQFRAIGKE